MKTKKPEPDHITDYERVLFYYSIPKVTHPFTFGLIVAYALCLLEAVAAMVYGELADNELVAKIGLWSTVGIVVFGIFIFMARAFVNQLMLRKTLALSSGIPDAPPDAEDLPDPFAGNMLLKYQRAKQKGGFDVLDNHGELEYKVETGPQGGWWKVNNKDGEEELRMRAQGGFSSFMLQESLPRRMSVYCNNDEIALLRKRLSFTAQVYEVECTLPEKVTYSIKNRSIFRDAVLVGRIYYLRSYIYLDIEESEFHKGILGLFVAMS